MRPFFDVGKVYFQCGALFRSGFLAKATVQAAMGAVPLTLMIGKWILAVSVLSILITAPLGAIAVALSAERCLK